MRSQVLVCVLAVLPSCADRSERVGHGGASDGGRTSGDGGIGSGGSCGSVVLQSQVAPGNVVVLFDQSLSMAEPFAAPDGTVQPKYAAAGAALVAAVTPLAAQLNLGAVFFPSSGAGIFLDCAPVDPIGSGAQIPIEAGAKFVADWGTHFSGSWRLLLGTPLSDGLAQAAAAAMNPALSGRTAVLLFTDGEPTCADTSDSALLGPVQMLAAVGIKTWVVGLPGAFSASILDRMAQAGGTGGYLLPSDPIELQMQLSHIAQGASDPCVVTLDPAPPDPTQVHLVVTPTDGSGPHEVPRGSGDGWALSADARTATLDGSICAQAQSGAYSRVEFDFGCVDVPIL